MFLPWEFRSLLSHRSLGHYKNQCSTSPFVDIQVKDPSAFLFYGYCSICGALRIFIRIWALDGCLEKWVWSIGWRGASLVSALGYTKPNMPSASNLDQASLTIWTQLRCENLTSSFFQTSFQRFPDENQTTKNSHRKIQFPSSRQIYSQEKISSITEFFCHVSYPKWRFTTHFPNNHILVVDMDTTNSSYVEVNSEYEKSHSLCPPLLIGLNASS